jgi:hypothetical protein
MRELRYKTNSGFRIGEFSVCVSSTGGGEQIDAFLIIFKCAYNILTKVNNFSGTAVNFIIIANLINAVKVCAKSMLRRA